MNQSKLLLAILLCVMLPAMTWAQRRHRADVREVKKDFRIDRSELFRLRVDVDAGEVKVGPGQSEDNVRIWLAYDEDEFHHSFHFSEKRNKLEIEFSKEGWLDHEPDRTMAQLDIELPTGGDMELDFRIKAGEIEMQLGGLRIADFSLQTVAGEVNLDFDKPNRIEMETLDLDTKIGESNFRRLGNARFKDADINGGIGELTIDFSGEMLNDAFGRVDLDIGETVIVLPRDVGTKLSISKFLFLSQIDLPFSLHKAGRYYYSENYDDIDRTFQLRVSPGVGECRIREN